MRLISIASVVFAAIIPQAICQFGAGQQPQPIFGTFDKPSGVIVPGVLGAPNVTVFVECWGAGGLAIGNPTYPTGGGGGGAYASGRVTVSPGKTYTIGNFVDSVGLDGENGTGVRAESGKQALVHNPFGAKGGHVANSIGTTRFSGGDGGNCFGVNGPMGLSGGAFYFCGGGGGGATPVGNGAAGANATNLAPGAGGGNGGNGGLGVDGTGATNGANATLLMSGGGAGGTGNTARGGKGLCKIS